MAVTPRPTGSSQVGLTAGHVLGGRYRLDDTLASGGMAQVWQGTDEVLRRAIAIKVLHPHLAADETFVARFRQEAIAVAKLSHPAIVNVYDTCSDNGVEAIVMELVSGQTLRQHLDGGPIDPWTATNIAIQVAGALDVAHAAGLVHRDIKPANILISEDGRVKVSDFGIAKAAESSTELTQEGSFIGTAKYLAPEQVEGGPIDRRTDLYSLGVVFYEMLCGRPPFEADGSSATALARLHSDPTPPRQLLPDIPPELEGITLRLLARHSADRYPDANQVRAALASAGSEAGLTTSSTPAIAPGPARQPMAHQPPPPPLAAPPPLHRGPAPMHSGPPPGPPGPPTEDRTEVRYVAPERRWLVPALLITLTAISLAIAGLLISQSSRGGGSSGDGTSSTTDAPSAEPVALTVAEAHDFDPPADGGDGSEDPEDIGALTDGDPATEWRTEGYHGVDLGGLKPGVGFYLELEEPGEITAVEIGSPSVNWSGNIYVADEPGASHSEWGEPAATMEGVGEGTTTVELDEPAVGSYVLVSFTRTGDTQVSGGFRTVVSDVRVMGTPG